jgi:hypothetical protein
MCALTVEACVRGQAGEAAFCTKGLRRLRKTSCVCFKRCRGTCFGELLSFSNPSELLGTLSTERVPLLAYPKSIQFVLSLTFPL